MKINTTYSYTDIENYAETNQLTLNEVGNNVIGQNFLILESDYGDTISLILTSATGIEYFYKVVYTDFK